MRVVESQFVVSTRKLVDSDDEQALLEDLIERAKPPVPPDCAGLHYLLFTPFRYPPLRSGSRFGVRTERGIFYASAKVEIALAEVAYYRFVFLEGTRAALGPIVTEHTSFSAKVDAARYIDLTRAPFAAYKSQIASKTEYAATQELGRDMRAAGLDAFAFASARDPNGGLNFGLFAPVFAAKKPAGAEGWSCVATRETVEITRKDLLRQRLTLTFPRATFMVAGKLPAPALS